NFPQGRGDYTAVLSDTLSHLHGRHALKYGGEVRRFNGNGFTNDPGSLGFSTVADFQSDTATSFALTAGGNRPVRIYDTAWGLFLVDSFNWSPSLTLELGLLWDLNMSLTEVQNRSVLFLSQTNSLARIRTYGYKETYKT